ncbi:MAG TPA: ABC transporter permease [Acholeplasma sp.]|jgi:putative ABC transport system permease protein|nr:ABC transporter permease [Acholeplasma sp.]
MELVSVLFDSLQEGLAYAILVIGVFISFRMLDFADMTCEGSLTMGAAITMVMITSGINPILSVLVAFVLGTIAGIITALLHTKLKIPPLLAGIIMMTALYSINLQVIQGGRSTVIMTYGETKTIFSFLENMIPSTSFITNFQSSKLIVLTLVLILVFFAIYYFFGTEIGMSIRSTGMNKDMSKAMGINTDLMIIIGLALSNGLIALSGSLIAQKNGSSNMDIGRGTLVIGLAAIILGEAIFGKRTFKNWLISVILGSFIYQIIVAIAINVFGLNPNFLKLIQAVLIVAILAIPLIKSQIKKFKTRKELKAC